MNHGPDGKFTSGSGGADSDGSKSRFVPYVKKRILVGERLGKLLDKIGRATVGSELRHVTWIDKKTGYKYDFRPKGGMSLTAAIPAVFRKGEMTETRPSGRKTIILGPRYNVLFRNCQDAAKWLDKYVDKFKGHRSSKVVRVETHEDKNTDVSIGAAMVTMTILGRLTGGER